MTNKDYAAYLQQTGYVPQDPWNFLKDWSNGTYPTGWATKPVTWVSLGEARAYCAWAGKRLPHVYEWQYAAQGATANPYPWGNQSDPTRVPTPDSSRVPAGPDAVDAHAPRGDSPFGVSDLVGNVWQYTDEFQDAHTRTAVLKGGARYRPSGSQWYFPAAPVLTQHGKYMLMDDGYERAGFLGFRCAADATTGAPRPYDPPCLTSLCGRLLPTKGQVDLSAEGRSDWVHWGLSSATSVDRKSGVQKQISDATVVGGAAQWYNNNPNTYVWSDGTPTATAQTTTGIYIAGVQRGFTLQVPATAANATLRVYVGAWNAGAQFTASLDDGTPAFVSTDLHSASGTTNGVFVIQFRSSRAGTKLTVSLTQADGDGNVTLQAATLAPTPAGG